MKKEEADQVGKTLNELQPYWNSYNLIEPTTNKVNKVDEKRIEQLISRASFRLLGNFGRKKYNQAIGKVRRIARRIKRKFRYKKKKWDKIS